MFLLLGLCYGINLIAKGTVGTPWLPHIQYSLVIPIIILYIVLFRNIFNIIHCSFSDLEIRHLLDMSWPAVNGAIELYGIPAYGIV